MRAVPVLLSLAFLLACGRGAGVAPTPAAQGGGDTPAADRKQVVAKVDGVDVTLGELEDSISGDLIGARNEYLEKEHQLRGGGLDQLIRERLLEKKAKAEGKTKEALLADLEAKVPAPTETQLRELYDQAVQSGRELPPFDGVRSQIEEFVRSQERDRLLGELYATLEKDAKVERLLPPLLLPKVDVEAVGPSKGDEKAPVVIVEFSDFECPFCKKAEPTVKKVLDEYAGKVRLVYREFPLSGHAHAPKASEAALCAKDQGKYWEMHEKLFENQTAIEVPSLKEYAKALGLDTAKFDECLDKGAKAKDVEADLEAGKKVGVTGTPAFFVNGRPLSGAVPFERFKEVIDAELAAKK
jgi:protein-disulfide isomerase